MGLAFLRRVGGVLGFGLPQEPFVAKGTEQRPPRLVDNLPSIQTLYYNVGALIIRIVVLGGGGGSLL